MWIFHWWLLSIWGNFPLLLVSGAFSQERVLAFVKYFSVLIDMVKQFLHKLLHTSQAHVITTLLLDSCKRLKITLFPLYSILYQEAQKIFKNIVWARPHPYLNALLASHYTKNKISILSHGLGHNQCASAKSMPTWHHPVL